MAHFFKKAGLFIARGAAAVIALALVALIVVQIVLIAGINLVSTGRGSEFIAGKVNQALQGSGYDIAFDALYYDPLRGFTVYDLAVSDSEGIFLTLDRFSLNPSLALSPLRTLQLSGQGGVMTLSRLPAVQDDEGIDDNEPLQPFETPDIFFRRVIVSNLSFERVRLGEAVAGTAYEFSPAMQAKIALGEAIDAVVSLTPGMGNLAPGLAAPETLELKGSFTPATLGFAVENFRIAAPSYDASAVGAGNFSPGGMVEMNAELHHDDMNTLTQGSFSEAKADLAVHGPLAGPAIDLAATLVPASLKERGLSDITLALKTADISQGMKGDLRIETQFRDEPVTLQSAVSYDAPRIVLSGIEGSAPALTLKGEGALSTETTLFDGTLSLSAADLAHYSTLAGITLGGRLSATADFSASDTQQQSAEVDLSVSSGVFDTIKIKTLEGKASLASLATPWPQSASVKATGLRIGGDVTLDRLNAAVTQQDAQDYKLTLSGAGQSPVPLSFDGSALLSGLSEKIPAAHDIKLAVKQGRSAATLSGSFTPEQVELALSSKGLRAADLPLTVPEALKDARIDIDAAMTGPAGKPVTTVNAVLGSVGAGSYQDATITVKAGHDGENVNASVTGKGTGIRTLNADAAFPMTLSLIPFALTFDQSAALSGRIAADIDLQAVSPFFLPPSQSLSGTLTADGTIAGTIHSPAPSARVKLGEAAFEDDRNGIYIADLSAAASVDRTGVSLTSLSATDGKQGTLSGSGSLAFGGGNTDISLRLHQFNAPRGTLANGIFDADLTLKGTASGLLLSGTADIAEMNILIPEKFSSRIPQLNIVEDDKETGPGIMDIVSLDMNIDAHNQVFVRGWGLDAEFGGTIAIDGTASAPQFNGTLSSRRGRYEEFGKRFTLARANLRFQGSVPPSPYLDVEATTPAGDVTGSVLLTGPAQSPSITFASTPSLPQDEVLSRILFGKDATKISAFQAVQLAQTIQRFSGNGGSGLDPLGTLRSATGLDDISVDTDESGATSVGVGKYLTDNVYLELSKGKGEASNEATIQIEVTPSVNIESKIGQDAQGGGGIFWKRDY